MMGKQGRTGSYSNAKGKAEGSTGAKKKIVIKPFKVSALPLVRHDLGSYGSNCPKVELSVFLSTLEMVRSHVK